MKQLVIFFFLIWFCSVSYAQKHIVKLKTTSICGITLGSDKKHTMELECEFSLIEDMLLITCEVPTYSTILFELKVDSIKSLEHDPNLLVEYRFEGIDYTERHVLGKINIQKNGECSVWIPKYDDDMGVFGGVIVFFGQVVEKEK